MRYLVALALATIPMPALAQETGTLIQRPSAQVDFRDKNAARLMTHRWARCVVAQSPKRVETYLALPLGSTESRAMADRFLNGLSSCISGGDVEQRTLTAADNVMRGALFEALYRRRFADARGDLAAVPPLDYGDVSGLGAEARQAVAMSRVGECVLRNDLTGARKLLTSEPGTPAENAAFAPLVPHLGACLPKDTTFTFSKSLVRGAIAEPLYKLSLAASPAG